MLLVIEMVCAVLLGGWVSVELDVVDGLLLLLGAFVLLVLVVLLAHLLRMLTLLIS